MRTSKILFASVVIFALAAISGCGTTGTERDYGNSVGLMIQSQTADPNAAMLPDPNAIDNGDGQRLNTVIEAYREPAPPPTQAEIQSNPFAL
jgi:hypothetical protein